MYEVFEQLMEKKGVTPYKVSKATGISQSTLSDWKLGKFKLKDDKLKRIADYFEVDVEYLKTGMVPSIPKAIDPNSVEVIELFNKLNEEQRNALLQFLRSVAPID